MIAADFQPRYNLRSKNKPTSTSQPKKILPRDPSHEPPLEEALLPSNKVKITQTRESEVRKAETQTKETEPIDKVTSETKAKAIKQFKQTNRRKKPRNS
jgi:hypothetical protein